MLSLHDAPALRERSALFNAIMYGQAACLAERELGAAVEFDPQRLCQLHVGSCAVLHSARQTPRRDRPSLRRRRRRGAGAAPSRHRGPFRQARADAPVGRRRRNPSLAQRRPLRFRHRQSRRCGRNVRLGEPPDADARRAEGGFRALGGEVKQSNRLDSQRPGRHCEEPLRRSNPGATACAAPADQTVVLRPLGRFASLTRNKRLLSYPRKRVSRGHDAAAQVGARRRSRKVETPRATWPPGFPRSRE